jgi:hypothetical protein
VVAAVSLGRQRRGEADGGPSTLRAGERTRLAAGTDRGAALVRDNSICAELTKFFRLGISIPRTCSPAVRLSARPVCLSQICTARARSDEMARTIVSGASLCKHCRDGLAGMIYSACAAWGFRRESEIK